MFFVDDDRVTYLRLLGEETLSAVRLNTHRGRPLASDRFLSKLESLLGRRLRPLPVGRPRKKKWVTVPCFAVFSVFPRPVFPVFPLG